MARILGWMLLITSIARCAAVAAALPHDPVSDEVVVQGERIRLHELRREAIAAEDRFFARYNELNKERRFDVHCAVETATGHRLSRRVCRPQYEIAAIQEAGAEGFRIRQYVQDPGNNARGVIMPTPPVPAEVLIEAHRPDFQRHMQRMVSRNPELLQLLRERAQAEQRFVEERRRRFGRDNGDGDFQDPDAPRDGGKGIAQPQP